MKIISRLITSGVLIFLMGASSIALAADVGPETITGHRLGQSIGEPVKTFEWDFEYDIGFFSNRLLVDIDIALVGADPGEQLRNRWEQGIEGTWETTRFKVPIDFNVDWVTSAEADQVVTVHEGDGLVDMTNWYTGNPSGWGNEYQGLTAAHEYGHMFGLFDEYPAGAVDPATKRILTGGLMATLNGDPLDYYYDPILNWYTTTVPEPVSMFLFSIGAAVLAFFKKKKTVTA